jgi:hypothetical protein
MVYNQVREQFRRCAAMTDQSLVRRLTDVQALLTKRAGIKASVLKDYASALRDAGLISRPAHRRPGPGRFRRNDAPLSADDIAALLAGVAFDSVAGAARNVTRLKSLFANACTWITAPTATAPNGYEFSTQDNPGLVADLFGSAFDELRRCVNSLRLEPEKGGAFLFDFVTGPDDLMLCSLTFSGPEVSGFITFAPEMPADEATKKIWSPESMSALPFMTTRRLPGWLIAEISGRWPVSNPEERAGIVLHENIHTANHLLAMDRLAMKSTSGWKAEIIDGGLVFTSPEGRAVPMPKDADMRSLPQFMEAAGLIGPQGGR